MSAEPAAEGLDSAGPDAAPPPGPRHKIALLLASVLVIALCGITYELLIGTLSSYLLGNSVTQFSVTIGLFLTSMGLGSFLSRWARRRLLPTFIAVEIAIGLVGGVSALLLFAAFAYTRVYQPAMVATVSLTSRIPSAFFSLKVAVAGRYSWRLEKPGPSHQNGP